MYKSISSGLKQLFLLVLYFFLAAILIIGCKFYFSDLAYVKSAGIPGLLSKEKIDYLFIGSSLTKQSYNIRLIENELDVNAYAVSYNGLSPFHFYKIIKYTLENTDIKINNLVFEVYPYKIFAKSSSIEDVKLFNSSPEKLKLDIIKNIINDKHDLKTIYELIVTNDNENIISSPITYKFFEKLTYNGGDVIRYVPGLTAFGRNTELDTETIIDRRQYSSYLDMINICKKYNIKLIFVEPLVPFYIQNGLNYQSALKTIRIMLENSGNQLYENNLTSLRNNDPSLFGDIIHLSSKGRDLWSREILRILAPLN